MFAWWCVCLQKQQQRSLESILEGQVLHFSMIFNILSRNQIIATAKQPSPSQSPPALLAFFSYHGLTHMCVSGHLLQE